MKILLSSAALIALVSAALNVFQLAPQAMHSEEVPSPKAFGWPVPFPEPALPAGSDVFELPAYDVGETASLIAKSSNTAGRNEIVSMTGVALQHAMFDIFSQRVGAAKGDLHSVAPLTADETAATLLLPADLPPWSMYMIWPVRDGERGAPIAINRTETWWIGPDKAVPGATVSVYGRNLARSNGRSYSNIYIQRTGEAGRYVVPRSVNPFRVEFDVPDLPPAVYEVWTHNGHGGRYGWSGPLRLDIVGRSPWGGRERRFDVRRYGAVGDGRADDTVAIARALEAADHVAPATVYFPKGRYRVSATLRAPGNVSWTGDGMDESEIRLGRELDDGMIVSPQDNVSFRGLTLTGDGRAKRPLVQLFSARNTRFDSVRINAWGAPALDAQDAYGLFIHASELIENGSFYGSSRQVFLFDNRFRMTGDGEAVVSLWGGRDFAMIGNTLTNADENRKDGQGIGRFFVGQGHFGSMENLYWERNVSRNAAPRDCNEVDCNKGEQICFEIVGSRLLSGFAHASDNNIRFHLPDWGSPVPGGRDLVIIAGRGAGQYRRIVSVNGATATLDAAWTVTPDKTSRFALAATTSRAAIYDNTFEGRESYHRHDSNSTAVLLYGNVYDTVVDSNTISRMRHGMMTIALSPADGLSPYFLQYSNNRVSFSNSGLYVGTTFADASMHGVWGGLGNVYRNNLFEDIAHIGVEYETWDHEGSDYNGTVFEGNRFRNLPYGFIDAYKLIWTYDGRFKSGPPARSRRINTVLYRNTFERGSAPFQDSKGFVSLHADNSWRNIGSVWTGFGNNNEGPAAP
jgi:polygalacturonase